MDNEKFMTAPTKKDVLRVISSSYLLAAPGSDGIPCLLYKEHLDLLGDSLTDILVEIFQCKPLPSSMLTSLMDFPRTSAEYPQLRL